MEYKDKPETTPEEIITAARDLRPNRFDALVGGLYEKEGRIRALEILGTTKEKLEKTLDGMGKQIREINDGVILYLDGKLDLPMSAAYNRITRALEEATRSQIF